MAQSDTGARAPAGAAGKLLLWVALAWSLFQLWYRLAAAVLLNVFDLNATEARSIHLAFALLLAFTAYPALKRSPRDRIPLQDWVLALVAGVRRRLHLFFLRRAGPTGRARRSSPMSSSR